MRKSSKKEKEVTDEDSNCLTRKGNEMSSRRRGKKKEGLIANSMVHWTQFERMRKREKEDRKKSGKSARKSALNIQGDIEPNGCNSVTDMIRIRKWDIDTCMYQMKCIKRHTRKHETIDRREKQKIENQRDRKSKEIENQTRRESMREAKGRTKREKRKRESKEREGENQTRERRREPKERERSKRDLHQTVA